METIKSYDITEKDKIIRIEKSKYQSQEERYTQKMVPLLALCLQVFLINLFVGSCYISFLCLIGGHRGEMSVIIHYCY